MLRGIYTFLYISHLRSPLSSCEHTLFIISLLLSLSSLSISSDHGRDRLRRGSSARVCQGQRSSRQTLSQTRSQRIFQGGGKDSNWICGDGFCRVLCEADFHPNQ